MTHAQILLPCAALVLLTLLVWLRLYIERIAEMRARRIKPQALAAARDVAQTLQNVQAADNFRNLFEVPVLFYVLCLALAVTQLANSFDVWGTWGFVLLRALHSLIHLTYNRVMHRFMAYAASTVLLFLLWLSFAIRLL
ncbi:MAG: MAPEG family protein [Sideroxydans sp.]|nr:MAPEG family protein [Sideroxydans sp.]